MIDEYVVDGYSSITKTFDRFTFGCNSLHKFAFRNNKIIMSNIDVDVETVGYVTDANSYDSTLIVTNYDNKVFAITKEKYGNYTGNYIDCNSHFGEGISSALVCTPGSRTKRAI